MAEASDIDKSDATKLHAEINQLLNQQFLITIAAITFFGVISTLTLPEKGGSQAVEQKEAGEFALGLSIAILLLFSILFNWLHTLTQVLLRLSVYLEVRKLSVWEIHYVDYVDKYPGTTTQHKAMSLVFLTLGLFSTGLQSYLILRGRYSMPPVAWWVTAGFVLFVYCGVIFWVSFGPDSGERVGERRKAHDRWRGIVNSSK